MRTAEEIKSEIEVGINNIDGLSFPEDSFSDLLREINKIAYSLFNNSFIEEAKYVQDFENEIRRRLEFTMGAENYRYFAEAKYEAIDKLNTVMEL